MMKIQFIRHATTLVWVNNKKILIDPLLGSKGAYSPIEKVTNQNPNPLTDLPISLDEIIDCDAILVTHLHRDHFDQAAIENLPKHIELFCQPQDTKALLAYGFSKVSPVKDTLIWEGINFYRTNGRHGHGVLALKMAPVSGFVIKAPDEPILYILGDTVWCKDVEIALATFNPDIAISNCGRAQFACGKPITMGEKDIHKVRIKAPHMKLICIHMEAWNHCGLLREDLKTYVALHKLTDVIIPNEGDLFEFLMSVKTNAYYIGNNIDNNTSYQNR